MSVSIYLCLCGEKEYHICSLGWPLPSYVTGQELELVIFPGAEMAGPARMTTPRLSGAGDQSQDLVCAKQALYELFCILVSQIYF